MMVEYPGRRNDYSQNFGIRSESNGDPRQPYPQYPQNSNPGYLPGPYGSPRTSFQQLSWDSHPCWPPRNTYQHPPPAISLPPIQPPIPSYPHKHHSQEGFAVPPPTSHNSGLNTIQNPNSHASFGGQLGPLLQPFPENFERRHVFDPRSAPQSQPFNNDGHVQTHQVPPAPFQNSHPPLNPYEQQQTPPLHNPYCGNQQPWPPLRHRYIPQSPSSSPVRSTTPSTPPSRNSSRRSSFNPSSLDDDNYSRLPRRLGDFRSRYRNSHEQRRVDSPVNSHYLPDNTGRSHPEFRNPHSPRTPNENSEWAGQPPRTPPHIHFQATQYPNTRPPLPPIARRARPDLDLPDPATGSVLWRIRDTGAQRNERLMSEGRGWKRQRRNWGSSR